MGDGDAEGDVKNLIASRRKDLSPLLGSSRRRAETSRFGPDHVFHSIRKTMATQLEQAAVAEGIAADILGHEKKTLSYGLYSSGSSTKQKLEAISKVAYPVPLNAPATP